MLKEHTPPTDRPTRLVGMRLSGFNAGALKLAWSMGMYAIAGSIPAVSNFLLTPVLLRRLGVNGFSMYALAEPIILIVGALLLAGSQFAVLREIATGERTGSVGLGILMSIVSISLFIIDVPAGAALVFAFGLSFAAAICFTTITEALASALTCVLRAQNRIALVVVNEGGRVFALLALAFACELLNSEAMKTVNYVIVARGFITVSIFCILAARFVRPGIPSFRMIREAVRYGLPLLGSMLVLQLAMTIDRYTINWSGIGAASLTTYVVHIKVAGILGVLFLAPLFLWFPVQVTKYRGNLPEHEMACISGCYMAAFILAAMIILLTAPLFWKRMFPSTEFDGYLMMTSMMVLGFQGLGTLWNTGSLQPGHTKWNIIPPALFLGIMILLGTPGAKEWGVAGVATAKLIALIAYTFSFFEISRRTVGKPVRLLPLSPFAVSAVLCLLYSLLNPSQLIGRIAVVIALFAFVALGIARNAKAIVKTIQGN